MTDYDECKEQQMQFGKGSNGQQTGNLAKLAKALRTIANEKQLPLCFLAVADAVAIAEQVAATYSSKPMHTAICQVP